MKDGMLELKDAPMFGRVMRDESICKDVLEVILGIEIDHIEYLNTEQTFDPAIDAKGVRLDVFCRDSNKVFDVEMQTTSHPSLMRRMRYYQSAMDTVILGKGRDYNQLKDSYLIFVCTFDPFKEGSPAYHIERVCLEHPTISMDNGSHWLVINAAAWQSEPDKMRSSLLEYIVDGIVTDGLSKRLDLEVSKANDDLVWRKSAMGLMTMEMSYQADLTGAREEGFEQGMQQGEAIQSARYDELIDKMLDAGRTDDLKRAANDPAYREQLFQEFAI